MSTQRPVAKAPRRGATSALFDDAAGRLLVVKGGPEQVLAKCTVRPDRSQQTLDALFANGRRVVAAARKPARDSLGQLAALGIEVTVATGGNPRVASISAPVIAPLDGDFKSAHTFSHTIFARISPAQQARLIVLARRSGFPQSAPASICRRTYCRMPPCR